MQRDLCHRRAVLSDHARRSSLNLVAGATGLKRIIREPTVNRPGLVLSGFTRYFANKRVQVIGNAEAFFLKSLPPEEQRRTLRDASSPTKSPASSSAATCTRTSCF